MEITQPLLNGLILITPKVFEDKRGYFYESYNKNWLPEIEFVQANHVKSAYGVIRGLHYQSAPGQAKLIRTTRGKIIDVAVDIRTNSPTFGKWSMVELSENNQLQLFIPIGFAHGYVVLSPVAEVQYLCSNYYDSKTESGIKWDDPDINIKWPELTIPPIVSERDMHSQSLKEYKLL